MFLMIFVNDLWSVTGVPDWLGHTEAHEDGMGFSDVIFPLFLFIVGLSIPLAINVRLYKQDSHTTILYHIIERTFALLVMGFYMVNYGVINDQTMPIDKNMWQLFMALAIVLIWLDYKRLPKLKNVMVWSLKVLGVSILLILAWIYQGGTANQFTGMHPHWWGILGLIGWAYFLNSVLYLFSRKHSWVLSVICIILLFMNVQENGYFEKLPSYKFVISASNHVLVMTGVLCTLLYLKLKETQRSHHPFVILLLGLGVLFIVFGLYLRPEFIISKILATPSWTSICIGISLISYAVLYTTVDRLGFFKWSYPIKPAGTSTLTCYLMPFFIYPLLALSGFQWPSILSEGLLGVLKSLAFSFVIILLVGFMEKRNLRLKI